MESSFNYETISYYKLIIKAEDHGYIKLSSLLTLHINIKNVDEKLTIDGPFSKLVPENTIQGFEIVKVTATDPDTDPNTIQYSIVQTNIPFAINADGIISLSGQIDREGTVYVYNLQIEARIGSDAIQTNVTITVTDFNDNTPSFLQIAYSGTISEAAVTNDLVILQNPINSADLDATSPNNDVEFSIIIGNNDNAFKMDPVCLFICFIPSKSQQVQTTVPTGYMLK